MFSCSPSVGAGAGAHAVGVLFEHFVTLFSKSSLKVSGFGGLKLRSLIHFKLKVYKVRDTNLIPFFCR